MNSKLLHEVTPYHEYRTRVGAIVSKNRQTKKLSLDDLAVQLNINAATVSKIESGKFPVNVDLLEKLSQILDFDMQLLPK